MQSRQVVLMAHNVCCETGVSPKSLLTSALSSRQGLMQSKVSNSLDASEDQLAEDAAEYFLTSVGTTGKLPPLPQTWALS